MGVTMGRGVLFGRGRSGGVVDFDFDFEAELAEGAGFETAVAWLDEVVLGAADDALGGDGWGTGRTWVYRGYILSAEEYEGLHDSVSSRGDRMLVDPASYEQATYMPEYLPRLGDATPASRWTYDTDPREVYELAQELGGGPWLIKDHIKSAKEHWLEACFIPEGANLERFEKSCEALVRHRGDRFARGIVVREFVELARVPYAMPERPVHDEHRIFFVDGEVAAHAPYHEVDIERIDAEAFAFLGDRIDSPFFAADVARLADGGATVVEINDGGIASLPDDLDVRRLYEALAAATG